ncbi:MAG: EamA family transporter [Clostridia bacterium]|nr:EamA family transporter [Clostridia bacterium]
MFKDKKVFLAYLSVCIIWGSTYLAIRIGVESLPPMLFAGTRFIMASGTMLFYAKVRGLKFPEKKIDYIHTFITGLFLLTGANGLVVFSEQYIESGMVSLMIAICPLLIMIIEVLILKAYKIRMTAVIGTIIGFSGVAFLVVSNSNLGHFNTLGMTLGLLAPVFWAVGSVYSKYNKVNGDIVPVIAFQMLAGGVGQLIIALARNEFAMLQGIEASGVFSWLYLIIFGSIIGYSSYIYILKHLPASVAGTYAYVNPVVAVILGGLILNEKISFEVILSTLIILIGVVMVTQTKKEKNI